MIKCYKFHRKCEKIKNFTKTLKNVFFFSMELQFLNLYFFICLKYAKKNNELS